MAKESHHSTIVFLPLDSLTPTPDNPRYIPPEAVDAVADSISKYGMNQPIVITSPHNRIVAGHTRYLALTQLRHTTAPCIVIPPDKAHEYLIADNATALTSWDYDALDIEITSSPEEDYLSQLFAPLEEELERARAERDTPPPPTDLPDRGHVPPEDRPQGPVTLVCSSCRHTWEQHITSDDIAMGYLPTHTQETTTTEKDTHNER